MSEDLRERNRYELLKILRDVRDHRATVGEAKDRILALLPTEGEPVAEVLSCGADEMAGAYMDVRPLGEPLPAGTKLYANTHLIHIEALLQNAWMAGFEHAMDYDEPTPEVKARQYAEHINRGGE